MAAGAGSTTTTDVLTINYSALDAATTREREDLKAKGISTEGLSVIDIRVYAICVNMLEQLRLPTGSPITTAIVSMIERVASEHEREPPISARRDSLLVQIQRVAAKFSQPPLLAQIAQVYSKVHSKEAIDMQFAIMCSPSLQTILERPAMETIMDQILEIARRAEASGTIIEVSHDPLPTAASAPGSPEAAPPEGDSFLSYCIIS